MEEEAAADCARYVRFASVLASCPNAAVDPFGGTDLDQAGLHVM